MIFRKLIKNSIWICVSLSIVLGSDPNDEQLQYIGKQVFDTKGCGHCHAINGNGGKGGPDLGRDEYYGTYLEFASTLWNHFPKMESKMKKENEKFQEITEEEMTALVDFLLFMRFTGTEGSIFRGRKLLKSMKCLDCHAVAGEGGNLAPDLTKHDDYISPISLIETMWNHGPEMRGLFESNNIKRKTFVKDDFSDLAAAIKSYRSPTGTVPPDAFKMGSYQSGQQLINTKGCTQCHDNNNVGIAPSFKDINFDFTVVEFAGRLWNHGPKMWDAMEQNNIEVPEFEKQELSDIITYIYRSKLKDDPGNKRNGYKLLVDKDCMKCHSVNGAGGQVAKKDFAQFDGLNSPISLIAKMWNHAPNIHKKMDELNIDWPKLNSRDMADLYSYFVELNSPPK